MEEQKKTKTRVRKRGRGITRGGAERIRNGRGEWKGRKSKRTEGRETREGISTAVSDGFHVWRSRAELSWLQVGVVGH